MDWLKQVDALLDPGNGTSGRRRARFVALACRLERRGEDAAAHIARASLESIAYQTLEVIRAMQKDSGIAVRELRVDGGATVNNLLMQFQADLLRIPVIRSAAIESTVLGAAYAAGLAVGFWNKKEDLKHHWKENGRWAPEMDKTLRDKMCAQWDRAVKRASGWMEEA